MATNKETIQKHEQMFYPTVRVRAKNAGVVEQLFILKNIIKKFILML